MRCIFGGTDKSVPYDGDIAKFQFVLLLCLEMPLGFY